jgi:NADH-quinone oxidoreductase subunit C
MGVTGEELVARARELLGDAVVGSHAQAGDATIQVAPDRWLEVARSLRDHPDWRCEFLMDLTAVDYYGTEPRLEVVAHLHSLAHNHRLRLKTRVPEGDPSLASLTPLWQSANWLERECYDMFGVVFTGHPDLRRLLMYEEFVGHPLRKDYPVAKRQPLVPERDPIEQGWKPA